MNTQPAASCPSTFTLDRHLIGELTPEASRAVEVHLAECAACQARWAELARFNADFAVPCPSFSSIRQARVGRWKKLALSGAVVSAVGALAAIFWPTNPVEEVRTKGGLRLGYHVSRAGAVWLAGPNEELLEHDSIQFIFTAPQPGFLAVFSVDGRGEVSRYYPGEGDRAAVYDPEQSRVSTSTVLDAALGEETFVAVFCNHSFQTKEVARNLEQVKTSPEQLRFQDCSVETLRAKKVRP